MAIDAHVENLFQEAVKEKAAATHKERTRMVAEDIRSFTLRVQFLEEEMQALDQTLPPNYLENRLQIYDIIKGYGEAYNTLYHIIQASDRDEPPPYDTSDWPNDWVTYQKTLEETEEQSTHPWETCDDRVIWTHCWNTHQRHPNTRQPHQEKIHLEIQIRTASHHGWT